MNKSEDISRHFDNFKTINDLANIRYLEAAAVINDKIETLSVKSFDSSFTPVSCNEILAEFNFTADKNKTRIDYEMTRDGKNLFISIFPVFTGTAVTEYIFVHSSKALSDIPEKLVTFFINDLRFYLEQTQACDPNNNKYKDQLMKLREMQAKLFPSFQNIGNFDIKSAYLPSDLMGGNFIDGFFINETVYEIVICDVGRYDATSSFTGATIRSMIRSHSSAKAIPSAIVYSVTSKLNKIIKENMDTLTFLIIQINIKSGEISISSFGSLNILYYISTKKAVTNLNTTEIGKQLSKKLDPKDIKIRIDSRDSLMFFSNGVKNATSANGKELFGERNIITEFVTQLNENSLKLTQNMIEKIYTFTDFAPLEEDIIILSIKKQKT
ncbi:MAG: SpoIIE family protein phosphatase [Spirochaetes bacterium]|nr:SpoIIE family protein phosphatase [Spirochaetota bacterium]